MEVYLHPTTKLLAHVFLLGEFQAPVFTYSFENAIQKLYEVLLKVPPVVLLDVYLEVHFEVLTSSDYNLRASVKKIRAGARVYIKVAWSQSVKVCVGARVYIERARVYIERARVYIERARVYIKNQK